MTHSFLERIGHPEVDLAKDGEENVPFNVLDATSILYFGAIFIEPRRRRIQEAIEQVIYIAPANDASSANPLMVSFLLSSSAPTTQTTQLKHGVHLSLKNPSVARGIALGLMSPDPPEPPYPPDLGSVMVTMGIDLRVVLAEEWWEERWRYSSLDDERDLGLMVTDFLETRGGGGGDSWCSSDSDSEFPDPSYLSDKIQETSKYMPYAAAYNVFLAISE
ncbi:hypothetical protein F2Q70_00029891 [Brassica cretica]|uniref:Uncharacterized protein n=1 Tax=Brassica cretica TaxID=69181 RepID=A0A8S9FKQ3_BRACR|nr:hypothetical protein F2Q70_00029891 [Brassica cretica]